VAGVGVALAVRKALEKHDLPGTVVLLGTPGKPILKDVVHHAEAPSAEEGGQGKAALISEGAYKEMDACVM
jgi:metal-dependent amidase/aminoacylase/carboxypeptidase family protein